MAGKEFWTDCVHHLDCDGFIQLLKSMGSIVHVVPDSRLLPYPDISLFVYIILIYTVFVSPSTVRR